MLKRLLGFTTILTLVWTVFAFGVDKKQIKGPQKRLAPIGAEEGNISRPLPAHLVPTQATGPGTVLFPNSTYDAGTNSSVPRNIHNFGDGTLSVARMEESTAAPSDRATYFAHNDGTAWLLPMTRVEGTRTGWGNISAMPDGREVTGGHSEPSGVAVNVDAIPGFGLWVASRIEEWPDPASSQLTWPRTAVDGVGNIHIYVTHFTDVFFPFIPSQPPIYARSTDGGITFDLSFAFQPPGAVAMDPPDTTGGLWLGGGDSDSYQIDAWNNKVGFVAWTVYPLGEGGAFRGQDILFSESEDNGQTFTWMNVTNTGTGVPPAEGDYRPTEQLDFIYDNNGEPHLVFTNFLALPDSAGTSADMFADADAPLMHWSPSTGISEVIRRSAVPDAEISAATAPSDTWARGLGSGIFWPSLGVDAANNLYVVFNVPTIDLAADTTNFLDIFASASVDGGATWGTPAVNVTNSPDSEDKHPSLAKLVDDNLHIVYHSDGTNGGQISGNPQTETTTLLYFPFPAAEVPTERTTSVPDVAGELPRGFSLAQNYPNPFNPTTQIDFQIPVSGKVSLKVYNLVGQEVATLINARLPAGEHSYTWNAAKSLPSGVYVYKLKSQGFSDSKKLVLMK